MNTAERAFYSHLTDPDSLDIIVREGFSSDLSRLVIPSEIGRKLTEWAIDYYFKSKRTVAPSKEAILQTWGSELGVLVGDDETIEDIIIDDVEIESVHWSIEQLRSQFVDYQAGEFSKLLAKSIRQADPPKRPEVLAEHSQILHILAQSVISRRNEMDGAEGLSDALKRYQERVDSDHKYNGITFGLPEIDDHILGIHAGELGIFAGTSGGGKSWWAGIVCLEEFKRGRKTILFTLENDVEMTYDRLACLYCRVDYTKWQRSECDEGDLVRVREFLKIMDESSNRPIVCQPDESEATGVAMVRRAIVEECDSILIDQLSHIEPVTGSKARQRNEIVAEIVKDLDKQIKRGALKIPCLLFHQVNRAGRDAARKNGRFLMDHMGEATQVENAATVIFAIYQSPDHETVEQAELQMLKFRRGPCKDWLVEWRPYVGDVRVRSEVERD